MKKKPPPKGAPRWMATFADMSTLLLTFFVLMLSFANVDVEKFKEMLGSVAKAYGVTTKVKGDYQAVLIDDKIDRIAQRDQILNKFIKDSKEETTSAQKDKSNGNQELSKFEEMLSKSINNNQMDEFAEIYKGENGLRIRIKGVHVFDTGNAELKEDIIQFLQTIYEGMALFDYNLLVEGHTDNTPVSSSKYASNWELSASRAASVVRHLIKIGVKPERLMPVGHADNFPIADNETEEGRAKNRRVEFIFTEQNLRLAIEKNDTK